jgi:hypothetical protein
MANYNPTLTSLARKVVAESGLTTGELAALTGMAVQNVSAIRWGRIGVGEEPARRILAACGYRLVITAEPIEAGVSA